ncbi:MAG: hypothetical protein JEZ12_12970 [Desulfobacterium sp.]|nr:hypothetical protein [Desulfobacterium sp.]
MEIPEFESTQKMQDFLDDEKSRGALVYQPSSLSNISFHKPIIEQIELSDDDVYVSDGKIRIKFTGLVRLGNAAGIEWSPDYSCRIDDRSDDDYVAYRAVASVIKNDGRPFPVQADYDIDFKIVEEETRAGYLRKRTWEKHAKKSDIQFADWVAYCTHRDMIQKRRTKRTRAESGAKARVLRALLGVKGEYPNKMSIVGIPFLIVRFVLDYTNSDVKTLLLRTEEQRMGCLYGANSPPVKALPYYNSEVTEVVGVIVEDEPKKENKPVEDNVPTEREQFIPYDAQTQGAILIQFAEKAGYDIKDFCRKAEVLGPDQLSKHKRLEFYDHLVVSLKKLENTNG